MSPACTARRQVDKPWHAAALGMAARLETLLGNDPPPVHVSQAFWHACAAGQRRAASICSRRALISTGSPTTRMAQHLTLPAARAPGRRTSLPGCASWAPDPPAPARHPWTPPRQGSRLRKRPASCRLACATAETPPEQQPPHPARPAATRTFTSMRPDAWSSSRQPWA